MNTFLSRLKSSSKKKSNPPSQSGRVSEIGQPYFVKHNIHVGYNPDTKKIEGLPQPWIELLSQANISKLEQSKNPKAVIDALKYYTHSVKKKDNHKFLTTQADIDADVREIDREWPMNHSSESGDSSRSSAEDILSDGRSSNGNKSKSSTGDRTTDDDSPSPLYENVDVCKQQQLQQQQPSQPLANDTQICSDFANKAQVTSQVRDEENSSTNCSPVNVSSSDVLSESNGNVTDESKCQDANDQRDTSTSNNGSSNAPPVRRRKASALKQMTEEEVLEKLHQIVNSNDPNDKYKLVKKIGFGASGTVYTAVDTESNRKVAIKIIDLRQQPKKETILLEIVIMRENQ